MENTAPIFAASVASVEGRKPPLTIVCASREGAVCGEIQQQLDFGDSMPDQFAVVRATGADEVKEIIKERDGCDVLILDLFLDDCVGLESIREIRETNSQIPLIVVSEVDDMDLALEALSNGADDFLPQEYIRIPQLVARSIFTVIERKKTENETRVLQDQLIQAEKLDSLGRIAAGVAHEVKNPLATIQMALAYLSTFVPDIEEKAFGEACELATESIDRAVDIIGDMVDFSRNDTVSLVEGSLNGTLAKSVDLLRYELNKHKTKVRLNLDSQLPDVLLDEGKILQLLINLMRNSIQAMEGRIKVIHLSTEMVAASELEDSPRLLDFARNCEGEQLVMLEVRDEGPGIGDKNPASLFEPFVTSKSQGEGTGLGLSVVLQIVKLHKAQIRVKNVENPTGLQIRVYFGNVCDN